MKCTKKFPFPCYKDFNKKLLFDLHLKILKKLGRGGGEKEKKNSLGYKCYRIVVLSLTIG